MLCAIIFPDQAGNIWIGSGSGLRNSSDPEPDIVWTFGSKIPLKSAASKPVSQYPLTKIIIKEEYQNV